MNGGYHLSQNEKHFLPSQFGHYFFPLTQEHTFKSQDGNSQHTYYLLNKFAS